MRLRTLLPSVMLALAALSATRSQAGTLFYSGDPTPGGDGNGLGRNGRVFGDSFIYSSFDVAQPSIATGVFGYLDYTDTSNSVYWEIRQGMSAAKGGTIFASGSGTGTRTRSAFADANAKFKQLIELDGLNVALTAGTYWLSVGADQTYNSFARSVGDHAVNAPQGGSQNLSYAPFFGQIYAGSPAVSIGLLGDAAPSAVPAPAATWGGAALLGAAALRRRRAIA